MSPPEGLDLLIVEKSGSKSVSKLFPTEPLKRIGLLTVSHELHGSPFGLKVVHGIFPSGTRVSISFPSVLCRCFGPVGDSEPFEESTGLSVETDVTHTLEKSGGVEVLSVQVVHDIWFLVEFVVVYVLDAEPPSLAFSTWKR
jgi:hypothetical protein